MSPDYIIFTDASVRLESDKHTSAYAAILLNCKTRNYTVIGDILHHRSICFCEGWAIYQGLRYMNHIRKKANKKRIKILVVTDSKLNVQIITDWIHNKWDTRDWYHWKKKTRGDVQNQDLYRLLSGFLNNPHMKIRIVHMRGHAKKNKTKHKQIVNELAKAGVNLSDNLVSMFIDMNTLADETAHGYMTEQLKHPDKFPKIRYKKGIQLYN